MNKIRLTIQILIYILLVVTPLILVPAIYYTAVNAKLFFSQCMITIIISIWLLSLLWNKKFEWNKSPFIIPLVLFACWIMVRNIFSPMKLLSWKETELFLLWIGLFFVGIDVFRNKKSMQVALWCMIGTGAIVAIYGIIQYFGYDPMPWAGRTAPKGKDIVISTFGNANYVAEYLQPILLVATIWFIFATNKLWIKIIASITALIILTCIVVSGAREAWIGLPLVALIGGLVLRKSTKDQVPSTKNTRQTKSLIIWMVVILVLLVIAVGIVHQYSSRGTGWLKTQVYSLSDVHQFQERFLIWQVAIQMIHEHPIWGFGAGGFRINYMDHLIQFMEKDNNQIYIPTLNGWQGSNASQSHNDYFQLTVDFGLIGIALYFWFIATLFWFGIRAIRTSTDPNQKLQGIGLFLALVAILIDSMVNFPLMLPANGLPFWILLALFNNTIQTETQTMPDKRPNKIMKLPVRIIGSIIVLILGLVLLSAIYHSVQASVLLKKGRKAAMLGQNKPALDLLHKSVALDPFENETRFALGFVYQNIGQSNQAIDQYSQAYGYDYRKHVNLGEAYMQLKNYPVAADEFEKAATVYPADPESWQMLGIIYSRYLDQPDKAVQNYEQYLSLVPRPDDAVALVNEIKQLKGKIRKNDKTVERNN
jgi:putative inorganic carbon (hco3(-)) transporter